MMPREATMTSNGTPRPPGVIPVGEEPPPMDDGARARPSRRDGGKPQGKTHGGRASDRFAVLNAFVDLALAELTRAEIAVWLVLYRDTRDGTARTSVTDIARRAGCDRSTVFRALGRLEERGLVKVVHRGGLGRGSSRYRVLARPEGR
jgi:hypothetical protein